MAGNSRESGGGLVGGYDRRNFDAGPTTYNDASFMRKIVDATRLADFKGSAVVVDAMSGPGKVGRGIQELAPYHQFVYMDLSPTMLGKVPPEAAWGKVGGDVREMPLADGSVDVVVARYGVKDLPAEQQLKAVTEMTRVLRPGGRLVIADIVAPDGMQEWLNGHHALKQELGGRDPETEGICHIPTKREWITRLTESGLVEIGSDDYVSQVTTQAWVDGKQIDEVQRNIMNYDILNAPADIQSAFHIREEVEAVRIDYPVIILNARKPISV